MDLIIFDKNWDDQEKAVLKDCEFHSSINKAKYTLCKEQDIFIRFPGEVNNYFKIDFLDGKFLFRLKTLSKNQPLFKALNISEKPKIIDATAGLGRDAVTFAFFGCDVMAFEENPIVYLLLKDGLRRAFADKNFSSKVKGSVTLEFANSKEALEKISVVESVYIDPMYPTENSKKALPKKEILLLREILPEANDLESLLKIATQKATKRVVLKRPHKSAQLLKPTHSFESKLVRFDLYMPPSHKV